MDLQHPPYLTLKTDEVLTAPAEKLPDAAQQLLPNTYIKPPHKGLTTAENVVRELVPQIDMVATAAGQLHRGHVGAAFDTVVPVRPALDEASQMLHDGKEAIGEAAHHQYARYDETSATLHGTLAAGNAADIVSLTSLASTGNPVLGIARGAASTFVIPALAATVNPKVFCEAMATPSTPPGQVSTTPVGDLVNKGLARVVCHKPKAPAI